MHRPPAWVKTVCLIVGLQLLYTFNFVWPGHDPRPNGLRIAVVGSQVQRATARRQLDPHLPGATLVTYPDAGGARAAVKGRRVYGAVIFGDPGEQVLTAPAASFTVSSLLLQASAQSDIRRVEEVVPLVSGDPRGLVLGLLLVPLMVMGVLGGQMAVGMVGHIGLRRRLGVVALSAITGGIAVATLIGPVLGTMPGPLLGEAGVIALAVFGLLTMSGGLFRLLGPSGLGVAFAVFLILGNPTSGASSAPELLITPWAEIGRFLTPGALASSLKSVAYFDGGQLLGPLAVLVGLALLGLGLESLAERRSKRPRGAAGPVVAA